MKPHEPRCDCGALCIYADDESEPCYGDIIVQEDYGPDYEDHTWLHYCAGHHPRHDGGGYVPEGD